MWSSAGLMGGGGHRANLHLVHGTVIKSTALLHWGNQNRLLLKLRNKRLCCLSPWTRNCDLVKDGGCDKDASLGGKESSTRRRGGGRRRTSLIELLGEHGHKESGSNWNKLLHDKYKFPSTHSGGMNPLMLWRRGLFHLPCPLFFRTSTSTLWKAENVFFTMFIYPCLFFSDSMFLGNESMPLVQVAGSLDPLLSLPVASSSFVNTDLKLSSRLQIVF